MSHREPGAFTEYNGRRVTATIHVTLHIRGDVDEDEIADWLDYEVGGGSIATANPLVSGEVEADFHDVDVSRVRIEDLWSYTDWNASEPDGSRTGRGRIERTPPASAIEARQGPDPKGLDAKHESAVGASRDAQ